MVKALDRKSSNAVQHSNLDVSPFMRPWWNGRHAGLRCQWEQSYEGSSPFGRTNLTHAEAVGLEAAIFNEWGEPPLSAICPINILRGMGINA